MVNPQIIIKSSCLLSVALTLVQKKVYESFMGSTSFQTVYDAKIQLGSESLKQIQAPTPICQGHYFHKLSRVYHAFISFFRMYGNPFQKASNAAFISVDAKIQLRPEFRIRSVKHCTFAKMIISSPSDE